MFRIAIIDDDRSEADKLIGLLEKIFAKEGVKFSAEYYDRSINFISDYYPDLDLVITDTSTADMSGFDTVKLLRERDREVGVIFLSQSAHSAIRGYEFGALDFLLKPVDMKALTAAIRRAISIANKRKTVGEIPFVLKVGSQHKRFDLRAVHYIEVFGHELVYHFEDETITVKGQLCEIEKFASENGFYRCFHSFIVNLNEIKEIGAAKLTLKSGKELPLSRRKKDALVKSIKNPSLKY